MVGVPSGGGHCQIQDLFARGVVGQLTDAQLLDRFTRGPDAETAFEAIVVRHGPGVLRVCRRALSDANDAEDAFQATFLVLARRARSIGRPDSLASWLHGVALRVSRKAKVATARRCRHEQLAARGKDPGHEPGHEVASIVREEIDRLPEPLRVPVYLCYFEGETYEVAARHMQVTEGAIRGRLARARDVLRERLSRRGVGDPTVLPSVLTTRLVTRAVPLALVRATTRAAMSIAQGCGRLVGVSAFVSELTEGVLLNMIKMKLKTTAVVIAALGFAATGGIALNEQGPRGTETEGRRVPLEPLHPLPDIGQLERDSAAQMAIRSARDPEEEDAARRGATTPRTPVTMTLDDAIERVVRESLDLRSKFLEIPLARADVLTAGLRNHPKRYTDGQIVPYGRYTKSRHGDPTNYDINISHPVDYSLKRQAHILDASRSKWVIEVQYQDAVRLLIGEVYTRFLDVQAAQEKVRRAGETSLEFRRLLGVTVAQTMKGIRSQRETDRVKAVCETAGSHFEAATSELERTKRALGALLKLSAKEAGLLEGVESLDVQPVALPAVDELVRLGLATRPDLAAFRLGLQRAQADLALQRAVRVPDAQILYQPFGIQDKTPSGSMSPMPWALGLIVPLYTNSAARARLNADQTGAQLTAMERQVTSEVTLAHRECEKSLAEVRKIEHQMLPCAREVRDETARGYDDELLTAEALLKALQDFRDVECRYIDLLTRLRRNTLDLNTAVANRIMP